MSKDIQIFAYGVDIDYGRTLLSFPEAAVTAAACLKDHELAFWDNDAEFWGLFGVNLDPATGIINYDWLKIATEIDISDLEETITGKMSRAPLNPTTAQIATMSTGQLYGDTVNHKGTIKGGQSFYDTTYIDSMVGNIETLLSQV